VGLLRGTTQKQLSNLFQTFAGIGQEDQCRKEEQQVIIVLARRDKNYVLFLGETGVETNQQPCLSLVQFQIEDGKVIISAYQRSSDANLGLPCDIYHLYLMAREIDLPLKSITLFLGNVHIYESNLLNTYELLNGAQDVKFALNV